MKSLFYFLLLVTISSAAQTKRARDYAIPFDGTPGKNNAITDVTGVTVGQTTINKGEGQLVEGKGPVRTGVTAILPRGNEFAPVYANWYTLNGNGDMTGTHWITESGFLETPILITNTGSVGVVRDNLIDALFEATVEATEEAIINALFAGKTMEGINGNKVYGLPKEKVLQIMKKYNRLNK